jgi:hypothetical protein
MKDRSVEPARIRVKNRSYSRGDAETQGTAFPFSLRPCASARASGSCGFSRRASRGTNKMNNPDFGGQRLHRVLDRLAEVTE